MCEECSQVQEVLWSKEFGAQSNCRHCHINGKFLIIFPAKAGA
jgi:hypothetical protein